MYLLQGRTSDGNFIYEDFYYDDTYRSEVSRSKVYDNECTAATQIGTFKFHTKTSNINVVEVKTLYFLVYFTLPNCPPLYLEDYFALEFTSDKNKAARFLNRPLSTYLIDACAKSADIDPKYFYQDRHIEI